MSKEIDEKVVSMKFDNKQFAEKTAETMSILDKLKSKLQLSGASKGLENVGSAANDVRLSPLGTAAEQVGLKFNALQIMATTALMNITNSAVNAGKRIASALTIEPIKEGFSEYELTLNAVQTTMSGTGKTAEEVEKELKKLDEYADQTVYSTADMLNNLPKFTNAGVDLEKATTAMIGIANATAHAGGDAGKASIAFYNLGQAIGTGYLSRMDYNSINNAGIATMEWKEQMVEAAIAQGTLTKVGEDQYKAGNKTLSLQQLFIDGLQEQWATTDVLMKVFGDYGDTTTEIGKKAQAAAQDVKTFSQLMDTLKASAGTGWKDTWQILIGGLDEAKKLWTGVSDVIGKAISDSAKSRNALLQGWSDGGGRDDLIQSFKNIFGSIKSIVNPIKEAFREIFPKTTAEQLIKITKAIKDFTSKLILSEKAQEKLKSAFKGFFAVIDIGITAIKEIIKGAVSLISNFAGVAKSILGVTGSFGDWISGLRNTIKQSGIFGTVIGGIVKILQKFIDVIKSVISVLKQKFVSPGFEGFLAVMSGIWNVIKFVADKILQVFGTLGKGLLNAFRNGDFKTAMDIFNSGIIATILLNIKKFVSNFTGSLGEISEVAGKVGGILDSVKGCFEAWQKDIQAKTLLKIAQAIAILAVSILIISSIDPARLTDSLGAVTVLFGDLMASMAIFTHIGGDTKGIVKTSIAMTAMSTSVLILAGALKTVSSIEPDKMTTGILGVAALSGIVTLVAKSLAKNEKVVIKGATGLIAFALAVKILASACADISELSWGEMTQGLVGVGVLMTAVSVFLNNTQFSGKAISTGIGIVLLAASMKILASACADFASMSWEGMLQGLAGLALALSVVGIAVNCMPKNMVGIGLGLIGVSTAILILSAALNSMGGMSWEEIGKSLITLAGALTILTIALHAMAGTLAGSAALVIATMAIGMLVPSLLLLSLMSWEGIAKGLVSIAGAFTILGIAGLVLGPLVPVILGLGAALALVGVGILAAGVGITALAIGLTTLAAAVTANAAAIVATISIIGQSIIGLIPSLIAAIGDGLILICKTIAGSAGAICEAAVAVIVGVCDAIIKCIPKIVECAGRLLDALLKFIVEYIPKITDAGMKVIIGFLDGIAKNIGKVVEKAVLIVTEFLRAIGRETPKIVDAGFDMIIDFINGIADAIEENTGELIDACINLGKSIVRGVIKGLKSIGSELWGGIKSVGSSIVGGFKKVLGINSPAKEMIPIGQGIDEGMIVGLENYKGKVVDASYDVGDSAVKSMSNAISGISDVINSDIDCQPTIKPVLDLSDVESGAGAINNMFGMTPSVDVLSNVGAINSAMHKRQNVGNSDVVSAIDALGSRIGDTSGNTYIINGITYDDGSNVAAAINDLVRAARIERRI